MSTYIGDPKLLPRVRQYLESKKGQKHVSIESVADGLQSRYSEYGRKKKKAFQKSIEKVFKHISRDFDVGSGNKAVDLEEKHIIKRRKKEKAADGENDEDSDSFSSDNAEYTEYMDTNSMNSLMSNMYRKSPSLKQVNKATSSPASSTPASPKVAMETDTQLFIVARTGDSGVLDQSVTSSVTEACTPSAIPQETITPSSTLQETHRANKEDSPLPTQESSEAAKAKSPRKKFKKSHNGDTIKKSKVTEVTESKRKFADVGGNEATLKEVCKLLVHMRHPEVYQRLGVTPPRGFLLHGPPGCGKTLLAHAIAGELELPFMKIAATEIVSGVSGESEEKVREIFTKAMASAPCVLFIDEIDAITQKRETASKDMERRIVSQLLTCMDDLNNQSDNHVLVIGATNRPDSLDPALRRAGRFDREIALGIPDENARKRILEVLCRELRLSEGFDFEHLARNTPGYVGADLGALAREAAMVAVNRTFKALQMELGTGSVPVEGEPSTRKSQTDELPIVLTWLKEKPPLSAEQLENLFISMEDFQEGLQVVQPSAKREGFATIPDVTWEDIGALHDVREELQLAILAPVRHPEKFKALGLTNPPGILLAGPPGCGKTLLAKAVANETGINFISVKGPELLNMYVGESERAVRQVFQRARNSSPCVIFFDELDALCPRRSDSGEGGSSVRVVNQLLTEMDGLEERKQVFIMAATNRPDIIDPAILRPGRLDKLLYVGLPTAQDRLDILHTITKNGTKPKFEANVNLQEVAEDEKCNRFTGADLAALVREAAVSALRQYMTHTGDSSDMLVNMQHFNTAFSKVRPSVTLKDMNVYEKMKERLQNR